MYSNQIIKFDIIKPKISPTLLVGVKRAALNHCTDSNLDRKG